MRAIRPWDAHDAECPFHPDPLRVREHKREYDARFSEYKTCSHPECEIWIQNDSKTCKEHRAWYDENIRQPARRLVRLLREAERRGNLGACPAIVLGRVRGFEIGVIAPDLERISNE